jgi:hypothetical protein
MIKYLFGLLIDIVLKTIVVLNINIFLCYLNKLEAGFSFFFWLINRFDWIDKKKECYVNIICNLKSQLLPRAIYIKNRIRIVIEVTCNVLVILVEGLFVRICTSLSVYFTRINNNRIDLLKHKSFFLCHRRNQRHLWCITYGTKEKT